MMKLVRITVVLLCLSTPFEHASALAQPELYQDEKAQATLVLQKIEEYFPQDQATMKAIAYCETRRRPFIHWEPDGRLRPNESGKSSAAGVFQVLLYLHRKEIKGLGLDMKRIDDYMSFVAYLHKRGRFRDWDASRACWEPRVHQFA